MDSESTPLLLTEIKTKSSIESLDAPDEHHLAQAHAYLYGLSEQYESITDAVILYADRETFETRLFHVEFD
ncbi:MAG: Dna2/Cas4 domain-containing protein, partial [Halobacteriaceae archaeon]